MIAALNLCIPKKLLSEYVYSLLYFALLICVFTAIKANKSILSLENDRKNSPTQYYVEGESSRSRKEERPTHPEREVVVVGLLERALWRDEDGAKF